MSARLLIGIAAIAGVSVCGLTVVNYEMVDQVNGRLPKDVQFSPLGWYLPKTLRLHREYRRLLPDGRLLLQIRLLIALMFGSLMGCAWALSFSEDEVLDELSGKGVVGNGDLLSFLGDQRTYGPEPRCEQVTPVVKALRQIPIPDVK
jgi:hypothetical protein